MNRARILLAMTLFPSVLFLGLYGYYKVRDRMRPDSALFRGSDGVEIRGLKEGSGSRTVLILPDPALDRGFNSKSIESTTGDVLAKALVARGFTVIRFDQRGTGRTPGEPRTTTVSQLASDALAAAAVSPVPARNLVIIAHGDSCATAALAHQKGLRARQWIFVSCGYSGTLLHNWSERLFYNMEGSGLEESVRAQARLEWKSFMKELPVAIRRSETPPVPAAKEGESPDMQVIRGAFRELLVERKDWATDAMALNVKKEIAMIAGESRVDYLAPEFDTVTPPAERAAMSEWLKPLRVRTTVLPGAEFFLLATTAPQRTTMERIAFLKNPLSRPNQDAVKALADSVE